MADGGDEVTPLTGTASSGGGDDDIASWEQIAEYESQLAGIEELLLESPNDESLLALKNDMVELLTLSRASMESGTAAIAATATVAGSSAGVATTTTTRQDDDDDDELEAAIMGHVGSISSGDAEAATATAAETTTTITTDGKKKSGGTNKEKRGGETIKDFVLPQHLIPNETDTEAERNRKRRAAKALKNKWRERKKEVESASRQKSWQSFQKKTGKRDAASGGGGVGGGGSIFSTKEGLNDRVGVVSKKHLTEFDARKRHKHS